MKRIFTSGQWRLTGLFLLITVVMYAQPGGWSVNPAQFQYNMTITAQIQVNNLPDNTLNNHLAVFCNGQIRGYAEAIGVNGQAYYFITAFANSFQGDTLYFRAFRDADQKIYESTDTLIFRHQRIVGKIASPYPVHLYLGENPLIYSLSEVNYAVNTCSDVLDVQSSDNQNSEGNGLSYSLAGGADAAKFTIDPVSGILSWHNFSPALMPPGDANGDNKYQVSVKVTDASGLFDIQHITVKIVEQVSIPLINCPVNLSLNTSSDGSGDCSAATNMAQVYANIPCALAGMTYELSGATTQNGVGQVPADLPFLAGITTVTYQLSNSVLCSFTVTVTDNEPPTVTCPPNTTVDSDATLPCAAMVNDIDAVFGDNCAGAELAYLYSGASDGSGSGQLSGEIFEVGVTEVVYSATDAAGFSVGCIFTITVVDVIPPTSLCKNDTVQLAQNGVALVLPDDINNGSSDACGIDNLTVSPNSFTCANLGDNLVTLTVTDIHNNTSTCSANVYVKGLSLGNLVFNDLNRNGIFEAGDAGINGVVCRLYMDDGDGVLDAGDGEPIASFTTTTLNGQAGSYLFPQLCPENYIVEIAPLNFNQGGALYDNTLQQALVSSPLGAAPDPDNDLNHDDNGAPAAGFGIASAAITLALNLEPTNDGDNDPNTNLSVDFGFKTPVSISIADVTLAEGTGGTTTAFNFTITRTDNEDDLEIVVNTGAGTAEHPGDFIAISNGLVTFSAGGSLTATVMVLVNHDHMVEPDETFTVNLSATGGQVIFSDAVGLGTINNDDSAVLTLSGGASQVEGSTFVLTATLNNPVQGGFTVNYSTNDGTATIVDNDYTDNDGTLLFAGTAGEVQTISVNTTTDNKVELNETCLVSLDGINGTLPGLSLAGSPQTLTISNDDAAVLSILADVSQLEAAGPQTFTITLSNPVDVAVTAQTSTSNGTATTADNDYNAVFSQMVSFPAGSTAGQTVMVAVNNDNKVEADETYTLNLNNLAAGGRNVSLGNATRSGTIVNDDTAIVSLSGGIAQNEGNTGTTAYLFTATLNNPVQGGFSANYSTNDGTATTADNDYADNDGALSFTGAAGEVKTFTVLVNGDLNIETDETFQTAINDLSGVVNPPAVTISGSPQTATIVNDELDWGDAPSAAQSGFTGSYPTLLSDNGPRHRVAPGSLRLGAAVDAEIDGQPNGTATGDGADEDGVILPSALIINNNAAFTVTASAAGLLNAWIDFNRDGDWSDAGEQVFTNQAVVAGANALNVAVPGSASLGNTFARFRISTAAGISFTGEAADGEVEDYALNMVNTQFNISDPIVTEGNAGAVNLNFVVSRTVNTNACSVNYALTGGTATTADNDYQALAAGTVNFPAGGAFSQTVQVLVNGDLKVELDETVEMSLSNPVNGSILDGMGVGTIVNDDAGIISINNPTQNEGDAGSTTPLTFNIQLSRPSDADVTFAYATINGTATVVDGDYVATSGSLTFTPGQVTKTVVVTVNGDCTVEPNEAFRLQLSGLVNNGRNIIFNGGGATLDGTGTINNDDALPLITCPANINRGVDPGVCTATVAIPLPTTSSICGSSSLEFRYRTVDNANNPTGPFNAYAPSGNNAVVFSSGRYEVEWRVTDGSGSAVCSFYLNLVDNQPPTIVCPPNQLINAGNNCSAPIGAWSPAGLSDNCTPTGLIIVTQAPAPSTILTGHNTSAVVTLTARDQGNNIATCAFTVTLRDITPPVAKCKNVTANLGPSGFIHVLPSSVNNGSTDNCTFTLSLTPSSFTCMNIGLNTVTLQATDAAGNSSTCTARVNVKDASGPTARCKNPTIFLNDVGVATLTIPQVDNGSTDNCGIGTLSLSKTLFNCSEISGTQSVTLTLKDVNGNTSSCLSQVKVRDITTPTAICEDVTVHLGQNGTVLVYTNTLADNSFDNCSVWSYTPPVKVYNTNNLGNNNLTITVKDFSQNAATCVSVVTVEPFNNLTDFSGDKGFRPAEGAFQLFPNPASGQVNVAFELPVEQTVNLRVMDTGGRLVLNHALVGIAGNNLFSLPLEGLPRGIYVVDLQTAGLNVQQRLVVQE